MWGVGIIQAACVSRLFFSSQHAVCCCQIMLLPRPRKREKTCSLTKMNSASKKGVTDSG